MMINEFRFEMEAYRQAVVEEGIAFKDSQWVLQKLQALYHGFDLQERALADQVIGEWVMSNDSTVRFDAIFLIDQFHLISTEPVLRHLMITLESSHSSSAPFERKKFKECSNALSQANHER